MSVTRHTERRVVAYTPMQLFELEFDFRSLLLQQTVRLLFAEAVKRMVGAFEARANQLYGKAIARPSTPVSSTR